MITRRRVHRDVSDAALTTKIEAERQRAVDTYEIRLINKFSKYENAPLSVLIRQDNWYLLVAGRMRRGSRGSKAIASERAYFATVYWRFIDGEGRAYITLSAAKVRIAPLKFGSAAVLGCRLAKTVSEEYQIKANTRFFWTDSKTVLVWLRSSPRFFKQKATPPDPPRGDHPRCRLNHDHCPFALVGFDYFGLFPMTTIERSDERRDIEALHHVKVYTVRCTVCGWRKNGHIKKLSFRSTFYDLLPVPCALAGGTRTQVATDSSRSRPQSHSHETLGREGSSQPSSQDSIR
ncbi:hypothetical protein EVAR_55824_1 [Eumeta japonica]|uniref:Uncharacterized protein n=1 Tax=Eumeta variegata TaxID=151549 RepID=A0A4C1ZFC3_EUMVA|nr:hypothetical protein EVAR_55824_1 [Eumeta japonica]